jgi:hypothetical protein
MARDFQAQLLIRFPVDRLAEGLVHSAIAREGVKVNSETWGLAPDGSREQKSYSPSTVIRRCGLRADEPQLKYERFGPREDVRSCGMGIGADGSVVRPGKAASNIGPELTTQFVLQGLPSFG